MTALAAIRGEDGLQLTVPQRRPSHWLTLQVEACGLCGTDLKILEDPPGHPFTPGVVLGHEIVGHAEGKRYVVAPNLTCGDCVHCRSGAWMDCVVFNTIGIFEDGGFAPTVEVPRSAVYEVPDTEDYAAAVLAEPASCVVHAILRLHKHRGSAGFYTAAILGGGIIGQLFQALLPGDSLIEDPHIVRRCASRAAVEPGYVSDNSVDVTVDAYGRGLSRAAQITKPGGTILAFGMNEHAPVDERVPYLITRKELTVIGAYVGERMFPQTIEHLPRLLEVYNRCVRRYPLTRIQDAIRDARSGDVIKAVIVP